MTSHIAQVASLDLASCASEPIHVPGAIQPHGALIAFDPSSLAVAHASTNVEAFLGFPPSELLGRPITASLGADNGASLLAALAIGIGTTGHPVALRSGPRHLDATLHAGDAITIMELEWAEREESATRPLDIDRALRQIAAADGVPFLLDATARIVRGLTDFDRVVVYRFDGDDNGDVVSECKADGMGAYLGLHFPESDIPSQARRLYLRNWIRHIPHAAYVPVPIVPTLRASTGEPLDLSHSMLRSVSPVHVQYLANMGVQASMSISLVVEGRLWGLISCGHRTPLGLPYRVRSACATIGRMVSLQLEAMQTRDLKRRKDAKADSLNRLVTAMRGAETHVLDGLHAQQALLLGIAQADGGVIVVGEIVRSLGSCPSAGDVAALVDWIRARTGDDGVFVCRDLGAEDPRWSALARWASGVLAIVMPTVSRPCVLWFRRELLHSVHWSGKPAASGHGPAVGSLTPHRSFEIWKEAVFGRSLEWEDAEVQTALDLRRYAIEIDLGRQVETAKAAVRARDDLVAVVSHDLRNPMSVVVMQAALIQRVVEQHPGESSPRLRASAQTIHRAAERMNSLLHDLLDLAKIEAGRFEIAPSTQNAAHIVADACELLQSLAQARDVELSTGEVAPLMIRVDPERIFQVLSNLIGNAVKFSHAGGVVSVGATRVDATCEFSVRDEGVGITAEQLPRIFERYWQAKHSDAAGAGLGLYIARGIVEAHGGAIRAASHPTGGTTFYFSVPLA